MEDLVQKAGEKLQKAEAAANGVKAALEKAQADLAEKHTDKNLIKKVSDLTAALEAKAADSLKAKDAYDEAVKNAAESAVGDSKASDKGKVEVRFKHKSTGTFYYRCGLRIKKDFETYTVPAASLERLKADPYIVFEKEQG